MKHVVAAVLISFCIAAGCFAKENTNPVGVQFSIGSGYTFYGDRGMKDLVSDMNSDDFSRIILPDQLSRPNSAIYSLRHASACRLHSHGCLYDCSLRLSLPQ